MTPYREPTLDHERRVREIMGAWAPRHAKDLMKKGWRLHDGPGLVWVRDDDPSLRLPDEIARKVHNRRFTLQTGLRSAGDYRDWQTADRLEAELARVPSYEMAAREASP